MPLEPQDLATLIVDAAADKKAEDIILLDIRPVSIIADYFVICSGTSDRQVRAIVNGLLERAKEAGVQSLHTEGMTEAKWVLIDFGDVIVHVFSPAERAFYKLEQLWRTAPTVVRVP